MPTAAWASWRSDARTRPRVANRWGPSTTASALRLRTRSSWRGIETVVVVSHVSPIKAAVAWALGGDVTMSWRLQLDQAAVSRIMPGPNGAVLRSFNEILYRK